MDRQDHMPTQGRRSASRATKLRRRRQRMNALLLIGAIAAIAWLVFILPVWLGLPSPFTELKRAIRTVGTDSGDVESAAEISDICSCRSERHSDHTGIRFRPGCSV